MTEAIIPPPAPARPVAAHCPALPLRVGTRPSPLALAQTRGVIALLRAACPALAAQDALAECAIRTTGDAVQDRRLAELGGKGLFAKELHAALAAGQIDCAVHSLKDLETSLPPGIVLAATLAREDPRDALILPQGAPGPTDPTHPFAVLRPGAVVGTASLRRQAQLLAARADLRVVMLRGNVGTRLDRLAAGAADATVLAVAGLRRLGLGHRAILAIDPEAMVPAAGQGIVGITVRAADTTLLALFAAIEDPAARAAATAERALLGALDGSCRTPIAAYARAAAPGEGPVREPGGWLLLTGLLARGDGSYRDQRRITGPVQDAARLGAELGAALRADAPADLRA